MSLDWENLSDPIFHYAATRPDRPAVIDGPTVLTYRTLAERVGKASVALRQLGIGTGDRVGVNLSSGADHIVLLLALLRVGAALSEINYLSASHPQPALFQATGVKTLFIEADAPVPASVQSIRVDAGWRERVARQSGDYRSDATGDALQVIALSSGSTGHPKAVFTTHRLFFERHYASLECLADSGVYAPDRPANFLLTASMANAGFLRHFLSQITEGGPVVLLPEFAHAIDLVKAIAAWDNAALAATSNMCRAFLACASAEALLFPQVRALISTGTPLFPQEKRAILRGVTPNFYDAYGAAGIGLISCLRPGDVEAKAASVGRPLSRVEVEIVDGRGARCGPGTPGRLRCRGATNSTAVMSLGEANESEKLADGWYYPGEVASLDAEGFLYIKGRAADLLERNGAEMFPPEIEEAMLLHPSVREVVVVGLPSSTYGQELIAVVVAEGNPNHDEIARHCRAHLSPQKWPDRIFYMAKLPLTSGNKPDRSRVRAIVIEQMARPADPSSEPPDGAPAR